MKINHITHENRTALIRYIKAKTALATATAEEKKAKAEAQAVLAELATAYKANDKTDYVAVTVQDKGEKKAIVYKETTAKGTIDWQAYALALGGTVEGAEEHRRDSNTRTSIDWATEKQAEEIAKM